ncbi:MAG: hypothetical protein ACUVTW_07340 [Thermogutta sp.]
MLTEQQVARSWSTLFKGTITEKTFEKAESLLRSLRPESPLRHRLSKELSEIRKRHLQQSNA